MLQVATVGPWSGFEPTRWRLKSIVRHHLNYLCQNSYKRQVSNDKPELEKDLFQKPPFPTVRDKYFSYNLNLLLPIVETLPYGVELIQIGSRRILQLYIFPIQDQDILFQKFPLVFD